MKIALRDGDVILRDMTTDQYNIIKSWNSMKWVKAQQCLQGRANMALLDKLTIFGKLPINIEAYRQSLHKTANLVNSERNAIEPRPFINYPVKKSLFRHQIRASNMALLTFGYEPRRDDFKDCDQNKGFGLLFEMGCGKTITAIAIMGALWRYGKVKKVLVVAPSSVCGVWPKEMEEMADFPFEATVMAGDKKKRLAALDSLHRAEKGSLRMAVINYESTWRDGIFEALAAWKPDLIVADESQRIKTHDASQSKAMHRLGDAAPYKLILSGTPVQNNAVDIFSQYRFLDSSIFGTSFYAFRNKYAIMGGFDKHQIVGYREMDDLIQKEHSIAYRVTKSDALDLPEQTFENRYIQLSDADRKVYDQLKRDSYAELESGGEISAPTVLTKLLRLQQLTGGFLRLDDTDAPKQVNHAKLDALMEIVGDCVDAGQKVVVFARFTAEIDLIVSALKKAGVSFGVIDGRTPTEHKVDRVTGAHTMSRSEVVEDFQTNPKTTVFLAQIQTAGLGITLHAASTAVFYSMDFNYASYQQATARIHRIGQRNVCTYIHLLVEKSIDEKVLKAIQVKDDLAKSIVDNWRDYFET